MDPFLPRRAWSLVAVGCALLAAPIACSSNDGGSGGPGPDGGAGNDGGLGKDAFAAAYCAAFGPCCAKAGLPSDGAQCRAFFGALSADTYDPAAGGACLAEVQAQASSPTFCDDGGAKIKAPSCAKIFKSGRGGPTPPGGACTKDADCALSPDGQVRCAQLFAPGGAKLARCQVLVAGGKVGDSPCVGTVDGASTLYISLPGATDVPARGYLCDFATGIACRPSTGACTTLAAVGESCWAEGVNVGCARDAYCDDPTHTCVARKPTGAACNPSDAQCAAGDTCDPASKTCVALLPDGAACTDGAPCASASCSGARCVPFGSSFGLAFLCGG
ncbi:MAG: hypothetical protein NVS3B10_24940 [Polyangiales bacterium]